MLKNLLDSNNLLMILLIVATVLVTTTLFAGIYGYFRRNKGCDKNYTLTLIILPVVLTLMISGASLILNNNTSSGSQYERALIALFAGILIIRYRSKNIEVLELTYLFFMIGYSFLMGLGYYFLGVIYFGMIFLVVLGVSLYAYFKEKNDEYIIKISVPEDMNFEHVFDDVFKQYTTDYKLFKVKSADLGTSFILSYSFIPRKDSLKELIDELRIRNGNMNLLLTKKLDTQIE